MRLNCFALTHEMGLSTISSHHARSVRAKASKERFWVLSTGNISPFAKVSFILKRTTVFDHNLKGLRNRGRGHWNSWRCCCSRCRSCSHCRSCCCCCSTENAPTNSQWTAGIPKADRFYRNAPNFYDLVSKAQLLWVVISAVFVAL